jgi:DNA-binding NarL/FixJ family response regulator
MTATKVLIVDDHELILSGVRRVLEGTEGIEIVGTAKTGQGAESVALKLKPHVIVMDIRLADMDGVEATRRIMRRLPATRIVGLSAYLDCRAICEMIDAGAVGYVLKGGAAGEIVEAVQAASRGFWHFSREVMVKVMEEYKARGKVRNKNRRRVSLTTRERQVVMLYADGSDTKQISNRLHISTKTVDKHRRQAMKKLCAEKIADLAKYADRTQLPA